MRIHIAAQNSSRRKGSFDRLTSVIITHVSEERLFGFGNIAFPIPAKLQIDYFFLAEAALQITPQGEAILFLMDYSYRNLIRYAGLNASLEPLPYGQEAAFGAVFQLTNFYWDNTPKDF